VSSPRRRGLVFLADKYFKSSLRCHKSCLDFFSFILFFLHSGGSHNSARAAQLRNQQQRYNAFHQVLRGLTARQFEGYPIEARVFLCFSFIQ
jgi:hypothetical protein